MRSSSVNVFFQSLPDKLDVDAAEDVDAVYQFDLSGTQGGHYVVTVKGGVCNVTVGTHDDPHVTLSMAGEDCVKVLNGELSGSAAAMSGRIKISGDLGLALHLKALFPTVG